MNTIIDITMLEELIVNESLNRGNSEEEYRTLFDNFGYEYLNQINRSVRPYIDAEARLAVCIAIVGSRNIDEFGIAMILLLQLAAIGGAYWVSDQLTIINTNQQIFTRCLMKLLHQLFFLGF